MGPAVAVGLTAVIVAVTDGQPRVLTVRIPPDASAVEFPGAEEGPLPALPFGPLDPAGDRTLELALRRWVRTQAGLELGYVEQLYTFGDRFRNPAERSGGPRLVTVAYLALVREQAIGPGLAAAWEGVYRFFPWEDWRKGRPAVIDRDVAPAVEEWVAAGPPDSRRRERACIAFGLGGAPWDGERVLERYELLFEMGLVPEVAREPGRSVAGALPGVGMAFDHRRVLASALGRLRAKIKYRPVVFELLPDLFTLLQLQRAVEDLAGVRLHKQNFRRLVEGGGLVEGTGSFDTRTGGRPAEQFRFRRDVLLERPAPGVGLPGARRGLG